MAKNSIKVSDIWHDIEIKLIAILRGVKPEETKAIVEALLDAGFRSIEVPLNSPDPFTSIKIAAQTANAYSDKPCLIGAGTVLCVEDVRQVYEVGGNFIVSPNVNSDVIKQTKTLNMFSAPGVYTPSECLVALKSGADILKVFPASNLGVSGIKALRAILPNGTQICAVGGVGNNDFNSYYKVGAVGFGLGSSLYNSEFKVTEISNNAKAAVQSFKNCLVK